MEKKKKEQRSLTPEEHKKVLQEKLVQDQLRLDAIYKKIKNLQIEEVNLKHKMENRRRQLESMK